MKTLVIVKVGGKILEDTNSVANFLSQFVKIESPKILVHGGGRMADTIMQKLGITPKMYQGRRITDSDTLDIVLMVYGGLINKKVVAHLQALQCNAIGLTGADMNIITATKRSEQLIDYGFAGDVRQVQTQNLQLLLKANITPVLAPITHNGDGQILNTNADTIAAETAIALSSCYKVHLIYGFEKNGVLSNPNDENSVIKTLSLQQYNILKNDGVINAGMIPKLDNAFDAIKRGVNSVQICNALNIESNSGTLLFSLNGTEKLEYI